LSRSRSTGSIGWRPLIATLSVDWWSVTRLVVSYI
jgi:hypothetical protein